MSEAYRTDDDFIHMPLTEFVDVAKTFYIEGYAHAKESITPVGSAKWAEEFFQIFQRVVINKFKEGQ